VDDLHQKVRQLVEDPKNEAAGVKLLQVDFDRATAVFGYDDTGKFFKNRKPAEVLDRINSLLRHESKGSLTLEMPDGLDPARLRCEKIPVAGHACRGCDFGLYRIVSAVSGVDRAVSSFKEGHVTAWIDPEVTNREALIAALRKREVEVLEPAPQEPSASPR
jgi:hypothetical protein